jgi:hypothetical protein
MGIALANLEGAGRRLSRAASTSLLPINYPLLHRLVEDADAWLSTSKRLNKPVRIKQEGHSALVQRARPFRTPSVDVVNQAVSIKIGPRAGNFV